MKKSVGFITIGQAGGNLGLLFQNLGYKVLFMNTSQEDLDTLEGAKLTYHIKNGEGCNKDRDKAKNLIFEDFPAIREKISENFKEEEFIYVIFSSGGGTGSGSSPMLIELIIQQLDKKVGAITILPNKNEPSRPFINAYECFAELEGIENICATFVLDNNSKEDKFLINKEFVELFDAFIKIPEHRDAGGNIDAAEMKEILSTRGVAIIIKIPKSTSSTPSLLESVNKNIFAPLEGDKVIKYIGISTSAEIDMGDIKKEVGVFLDVFKGSNPNDTVAIFCGLTYPYTVLERFRKEIEDNREAITKSLTTTSETKLSGGVNFLSNVQSIEVKPQKEKANPNDVFAKFMKK